MLDLTIKDSKDINQLTIEEILELHSKGYTFLLGDGVIKAVIKGE